MRRMNINGKIVLIVDDEPEIRALLRFDFEMEGCTVVEADSGSSALELLALQHIDLIISDIRMPQMDGVELLRRVRQLNPRLPPMILISGFTDCSDENAKRLGAIELFGKPLDLARLINLATQCLQSAP